MSTKHRIEKAISGRVVKTETYEIPMTDEDLDTIATHDALQAPSIAETLSFRLQKLAGVTDARIGVRGIRVTVSTSAKSGTWYWIEQTIINYLREAGGYQDEI